jgi:hypothetical protein
VALASVAFVPADPPASPEFQLVQPELFSAPGGMPNAWADFDNDGQLDEFVGFRGRPNRLYKQNHGRFQDVAASAGVADNIETRAAAWGDYDADGNIDLYVGFIDGTPNKLYHNDGHGHFTDVAQRLGVALTGVTRQVSWIDYDNDGDVDLFIAFRDKANRLFRNDSSAGSESTRATSRVDDGRFTDVTRESGIGDTRKTVGAVWFDIDGDGDLDLFVANQNGDPNGLFRNDGGHFVDVAQAWGVEARRASEEFGGVGAAVADVDGDGWMDLFVANYGPSALYHNDPSAGSGSTRATSRVDGRRFVDVTKEAGLLFSQHATTPSWGDYDNDGRPDLYVAGFLATETHYPDHLFRNARGAFTDVLPALVKERDASHGVQWIDFDQDGALDLALTNNDPGGGHYLFRNLLAASRARQSLSVDVVDARGRHTKPGAEVRVYAAGTRRLISSGLVDTGGGYCSQNVSPVHVATGDASRVDVEVMTMASNGRRVTRVAGLNPKTARRPLVVNVR